MLKSHLFQGWELFAEYRQPMRRIGRLLAVLLLIEILAGVFAQQVVVGGIPGYLPLHTLFETVSVVISMLVFAVGWNARNHDLSGNLVLLACMFFVVGWLDFSHTLSYGGMPDFVNANTPTKHLTFWLFARFSAAIALLIVALRSWQPLRYHANRYLLLLMLCGFVVLVNWLVLLHQEWLPDLFVAGVGLLPLKKNLEYLIMAIHLVTALVLLYKMRVKQNFSITNLFAAVCIMGMGELFFTLYVTMTDTYNVLGHTYKVIAYLFIYRTIVVEAVEDPYAKLENAQLDLAMAIKASNTGLWDWDLVNNTVHYSAEWKAQLGYAPDELKDSSINWESLLHPEDRVRAVQNARNFFASPQVNYENEYRLRHRDGSYRWIMSRGEKLFDSQGRWVRLLGSHVDISERMQKAREADQMREQLAQASKMESVGHLTAGIAHDFNNILGAMIGYSELSRQMLAAGQAASVDRYQQEILNAGARAKELIQQMLTFSRRPANGEHVEVPVVMLANIVREVATLLRSSIPSTIKLSFQLPDEELKSRIQPVQLHQIILNLGVNARDAMGEYGTLDISLARYQCVQQRCSSCQKSHSGTYARVTVSDSGSGMSEEILQKIFDPFFTTKDVGKGTGMGLSVVHGLVHAAGGHLYVESSRAGSSFHVLLPLAESVDDLPPQPQQHLPVNIQGMRIMVVDDEAVIVMLLQDFLTGQGATVSVFTDPLLALEAFGRDAANIDLVITDEAMPGMSGMLLAENMLRIKAAVPIILCTGYSEHATAETAAAAGIAAFLRKPVYLQELMDRIQLLRK